MRERKGLIEQELKGKRGKNKERERKAALTVTAIIIEGGGKEIPQRNTLHIVYEKCKTRIRARARMRYITTERRARGGGRPGVSRRKLFTCE